MKICNKCGLEKEYGEFYYDKHHDYYNPRCKRCIKVLNKAKEVQFVKPVEIVQVGSNLKEGEYHCACSGVHDLVYGVSVNHYPREWK